MPATASSRILIATTTLLLAAGLLSLAWPRLRATLIYLPVDTALAHRQAPEIPELEQLDALAGRARQALNLHPHYRYLDGESVLGYLRATQPGLDPQARRQALAESLQAAESSLALAPMRPASWLRVATARASLQRPASEVLPALRMSLYTGRVEPTLLMLRLQLLYRYAQGMSPDDRRLLLDQTLLAWRLAPREVAAGIRDGSLPYAAVADVLAPTHPAVLDQIDEVIRGALR